MWRFFLSRSEPVEPVTAEALWVSAMIQEADTFVPASELYTRSSLGQGSYGTVELCTYRHDNTVQDVAVCSPPWLLCSCSGLRSSIHPLANAIQQS